MPMRRMGRQFTQCGLNKLNFGVVFFFCEATAHFLIPAVHQIGVHHIRLTIVLDVICLASKVLCIHLRAIHAQLAWKAAQLGQRIQWGIVFSRVHGQQVHQIQMTLVVAGNVVVPFELSIIVTHVPVFVSHHTMPQSTVMLHRQVKSTAVPADQLGRVLFNGIEKSLNDLAFTRTIAVRE